MPRVKKEFYKITRILPVHFTNLIEEKRIRKDAIFNQLAEKIFDHPRMLDILLKKVRQWLSVDKSELTYSIAGYLYYIKGDFRRAYRFLLNAVRKNPKNLDNWFDLAFSLYHQDIERHNLGKQILFNFEEFVTAFSKGGSPQIDLRSLKRKARRIDREKSRCVWTSR